MGRQLETSALWTTRCSFAMHGLTWGANRRNRRPLWFTEPVKEVAMVAVVTKHGTPLDPTTERRTRKLLKSGKAQVYQYRPIFTIRMLCWRGKME